MSDYLDWNDALAMHFFRPDMSDRAVWLFVTDDLIAEIGTRLGGGIPQFVEAVKAGPPWVTARGLCQRALQAYEYWRHRGLEYPPYIGYLALFVLAAGLGGDFAPHAYYPRLRTLLGEPGGGALASFDQMLTLWDDLERWSGRDRQGALGVFVERLPGEWIHVGVPIAQTVLSDHERKVLPRIFAEAGLDPTAPPPDDELVRALRLHGAALRPRTRQLVSGKSDPDSHAALLDAVAEELAEWDGTVEEDAGLEPGARQAPRYGTLRLCVEFKRVSGRLSASLRCRVRREFPDEGLVLTGDGFGPLHCEETVPGWSSRLVHADGRERFDAALVDWSTGLSLTAEVLHWRFRLPRSRVRILVEGTAEQLPDLVETHQVPRSQPFYLLYREQDWPLLSDWASQDCRDFKVESVREGLPPGWQLASCAQVLADHRVRFAFPELAFSEHVRIALVGGIRSAPGNNFFAFAPPVVMLEGGDGTEDVHCSGQPLKASADTRLYPLLPGLPHESRIIIEAVRGGHILKRLAIYLTGEFDWRRAEPGQTCNLWGEPADDLQDARISGALTLGPTPDTSTFRRPVFLTPGVERTAAPRVFFVGRTPGQILCWPGEALGEDWDPVWAVPMGRRGSAVYCGGSIDKALPQGSFPHGDPERLELWKEVLWRRRKRIAVPDGRALSALWQSYVEAARRV